MYFSFILSLLISFFVLYKNTKVSINIIYLILNLSAIVIAFYFDNLYFTKDSYEYYSTASYFYENFNLSEMFQLKMYEDRLLAEKLSERNSGIYYLAYFSFLIFGHHLLSLASVYLVSKSIMCIYLLNYLNREITNFKNYNFIFIIIFLFEPWTIYFNNFLFLKEGFVFLLSVIITINFFKMHTKFKAKYLFIVLLGLYVLYFFRFYQSYLFIFLFIAYFCVNLEKYSKLIFVLFATITTFYFISFYFQNRFYDFSILLYRDTSEVIKNNPINPLAPIKFILSPIFFNIFFSEFNLYRTFTSILYNLLSLFLIISILFNNYKNKLINFLIFFICFFSLVQIFAPDELLTGGRHRSVVVWSFPIIISYFFCNLHTKKNEKKIIN